ncbi:PREDICTED: uncharacterized protein LOC105457593 isoform X2 [Wasmannia auropunctata]|uniref:uncharacterized protein LOC105457593 isoform X2 n=1 Tax=Wasmannia auropunctata TaxID=64793 RepID=UPI0005EDFE88|nr:PREDICTED: uncharacterized protein LOC105457593 isoform X2 [Wasmannia auropunctata]
MWFRPEMSSIFYVESEAIKVAKDEMETEVRTLKQELARTQDALKTATKKCRELVRELDHRTAGHESERILRDQQLSRILRALLFLEARLKQEQKSIRQMLCEKDNVIRNQQLEIAMLRRYTKNYIKSKRDRTTPAVDVEVNANVDKNLQKGFGNLHRETLQESGIGKEIASLKCEIITRLNPASSGILDELDRNSVRKTHSFAGSDISKASLTSSENTDASIVTTTTEGTPSLLSTEGFCEGESTDVSPGSTLNKCSSRCTPTTVTDSENETTMILDEDDEDITEESGMTTVSTKRRTKGQKTSSKGADVIEVVGIARTESKDDGMDCNFASEDEEHNNTRISNQEAGKEEPIYINACNEVNERNLQRTEQSRTKDDYSNNNNIETKLETPELTVEDTSSGNWYSDPDEDRLNDDVFRHSTYRPNSNHNSVLECVNQILLQDMEEEENMVLSVPRRFKHRGRIVRFQPARLSDIESVGSEMERKNSEESVADNKDSSREEETAENEANATEDEFGMRIVQKEPDDDGSKDSKAIPLVIIEPKIDVEESRKILTKSQVSNPPLKMERIEEKTCLQMSARGLTIAKNLDYEDIESLPEITTTSPTPPRTPPALPPKPQFRNNTLILKKIPSPSFLIDEKRQQDPGGADPAKKSILGLISSSSSSSKAARSLNLEEAKSSARSSARETKGREEGGFWKNRFNHVRSSFQVRQKEPDQAKGAVRVTNIVRHFEEFKIGDPEEQQTKDRNRPKDRHAELEHEFDIRQNFEEFNLDECDLSDDPDRPEGDGSERLSHAGLSNAGPNENSIAKDNNNVPAVGNGTSNSNGNGEIGSSGYDHFLEATGLSNKSILTPSRLLSNHKSMLKPKDVKYKSRIKATAVLERHGVQTTAAGSTMTTHVRHWTGPFV